MFKKLATNLTLKAARSLGISLQSQPTFWKKFFGTYYWGDISEEVLTNDAYGDNPYVFMVVDRIAKTAARLPRKFVNSHTMEPIQLPADVQLLLKNPNMRNTFAQFMYKVYANFLTLSNCYIVASVPFGMSRVGELIVPTVKNVTENQNRFGFVEDYQVNYFNTASRKVTKENVLQLFNEDIRKDDLRGFSQLEGANKLWKANNEIWTSEAFLHKNKGINGVLFADGGRVMSPTERKDAQRQYDADYTGAEHFGMVRVMQTKVGFVKMGMNQTDLKSIEARLDHLRAVCALYNVDSFLFGDVAGATFNNMQVATKRFFTQGVLPLCEQIDTEFSEWLLQKHFGINNALMCVDVSKIPELNRPSIELSQKLINEVQQGIITENEARAILYPELQPLPNPSNDPTT